MMIARVSEFADKHKVLLQKSSSFMTNAHDAQSHSSSSQKIMVEQRIVTSSGFLSVRKACLAMALTLASWLLVDSVSVFCGFVGLFWVVLFQWHHRPATKIKSNDKINSARRRFGIGDCRLLCEKALESFMATWHQFVDLQKGVIKFSVAVTVEEPVDQTQLALTNEPREDSIVLAAADCNEDEHEQGEEAHDVEYPESEIEDNQMMEEFSRSEDPCGDDSEVIKDFGIHDSEIHTSACRLERSVSNAETTSSSFSSCCSSSVFDDDMLFSPSIVRRRRASLTADRCFVSADIRRMLEDVDGMLDDIEEIVPRESFEEALADPEQESNCSDDNNDIEIADDLFYRDYDHDCDYDSGEDFDQPAYDQEKPHEEEYLDNQVERVVKHVRFVETPEVVEVDKAFYLEHKDLLFYSQAEIEAIGNEYFESVAL